MHKGRFDRDHKAKNEPARIGSQGKIAVIIEDWQDNNGALVTCVVVCSITLTQFRKCK